MKYSREYILKRAFDVFMNIGYDSTSISVLQRELGMSRGAMYRYFKNKEELFIAVIDEYFFRIYGKLIKSIDSNLTVREMIEVLHRRQKLYMAALTKADVTEALFLNYTALMIQAAKNYPDFIKRFKDIHQKLRQCWVLALTNSIEKKEIRQDINIKILSSLFMNASIKESSDSDTYDPEKFKNQILTELGGRKEIMDYLYTLIQV